MILVFSDHVHERVVLAAHDAIPDHDFVVDLLSETNETCVSQRWIRTYTLSVLVFSLQIDE